MVKQFCAPNIRTIHNEKYLYTLCKIVYELNVIIEYLVDWEQKYDSVINEINPTFTYYRPESPIDAIVWRITELENEILKRLENQ